MSQKFLSQQKSCGIVWSCQMRKMHYWKRPFHGFFNLFLNLDKLPKLGQHGWKERLDITKIAKFNSDLFLVESY